MMLLLKLKQFSVCKRAGYFVFQCAEISQNGLIIYIVSYVVFFITYLTIACCSSVRRHFPGNMVRTPSIKI